MFVSELDTIELLLFVYMFLLKFVSGSISNQIVSLGWNVEASFLDMKVETSFLDM